MMENRTMQKYKKPDYTEERLGVNPFIRSLIIPVRKLPIKGEFVKDLEDILINKEFELEQVPFTKLYASSEHRKIATRLPHNAKDLFLWLLYEVTSGKDHLWVNKERYMEESEIKSITTYRTALEDLVRYGFVGLTVVKDVVWINPEFFFRGSRVKKYADNVKISD